MNKYKKLQKRKKEIRQNYEKIEMFKKMFTQRQREKRFKGKKVFYYCHKTLKAKCLNFNHNIRFTFMKDLKRFCLNLIKKSS